MPQSNLQKPIFLPVTIMALIVSVLGLFNLYSATQGYDSQGFEPVFVSQIMHHGMGIIAFVFSSNLSPRFWHRSAFWLYGFLLCALAVVLILGHQSHGAKSWVDLGFGRLQPSEFGKVIFIIALSRVLSHRNGDVRLNLKDLFLPILCFALPAGLVVLQNDLGSSLFYGLILVSLLLTQGVERKIIIIGLILVSVVSFVSYNHFLQPYQKARIVSFMNPENDPRGSGYHLVQSKIAVGSGGFLGKGYLAGESHKFDYLPERHTDFIFPVLLEEWGFVGGTSTLLFLFLFLLAGISIVNRTENRFGFFTTLGCVLLFFWQQVINLGGVLGLIPLTGVTLPFFSYGGSSVVASWFAIGVLASFAKQR